MNRSDANGHITCNTQECHTDWWDSVVSGANFWAKALTDFKNGNVLGGIVNSAAMVADDVLTVTGFKLAQAAVVAAEKTVVSIAARGAVADAAAEEIAKKAALGPGKFMPVTESMSGDAAAYQLRAAGTPAGQAYVVNGTKFDGFSKGTLLEAKSSHSQFVKNGAFEPWFNAPAG
ncbi:MAG: hypothetical protein HY834_20625 [Devosia nanyangense]|uniref:Tox-REase-5 domain-containing protein n=1 Tax=Devosia nanyangense TaxID=1228055 RepID=A0A933L570_9HYPH|nr:hypothetical protein [Devosia nanyangense]